MRMKMFPNPYYIRVHFYWDFKRLVCQNENILVYPTGLIATVITVYLLFIAGYLGYDYGYFTIMSIYGW
jgi:uncharacterized membrane protein